MNYLINAKEYFPIWALNAQKMLWEAYENNEINLGGGISAMPSLHVATSFLFALVGWRYHRMLGVALSVFALIIMIGSVHLAWHYAIDGYFSIIFTAVIWHIVGYFLSKNQRISANTKQTL